MRVLVIFLIITLMFWCRFVHTSKEGFSIKGDTGDRGASGPAGPRGEPGPAGASIFDVSHLLLNGDTDLFKQKDNNNNNNKDGPQPLGSHSTLFS